VTGTGWVEPTKPGKPPFADTVIQQIVDKFEPMPRKAEGWAMRFQIGRGTWPSLLGPSAAT
jgi:hypothetical protein